MPKLCVNNATKTRKRITIVLAFLLVNILNVAFSVTVVASALPVHNINTGLDYATIQDAIDAPETLEGHTIEVDAGIYYERVMIYKNDLTILGENPSVTIIDSGGIGEVVYITANNIYLSQFTIQNGWCGIYIDYSSDNTITENIITDNWRGIYLGYSCSNTFIGNTVTDNLEIGILLFSSSNNVIYHNNFDNTVQVGSEMSNNMWDNDYPSGGNYWTDYTGSDENGDGIGDTPYIIDTNNQDEYPFINPWTPQAYDVALTNLEVSPENVSVGEPISIYVTVENQGYYEQAFSISAYYKRISDPLIGTQNVTLAADESTTLTFEWTPNRPGRYEIRAEASVAPGEVDTSDNTLTTIVFVSHSEVTSYSIDKICMVALIFMPFGSATILAFRKKREMSLFDMPAVILKQNLRNNLHNNPTNIWQDRVKQRVI